MTFEPLISDILISPNSRKVFVPCSNYSDEESWNEKMAQMSAPPEVQHGGCTWTETCIIYDSGKCYQPLENHVRGDGHVEDPPVTVSVGQDSLKIFLDSFSSNDCTTEAVRNVVERLCDQEYSPRLLKAFDSRQNC